MTAIILVRVCPHQGTKTAPRDFPAEKVRELGWKGTTPRGSVGPGPDLCLLAMVRSHSLSPLLPRTWIR